MIKKPTKRDISKLLGRRIGGWNDKRSSYNRIKLTEKLTFEEMNELEQGLSKQFPEFKFAIGNVLWIPDRAYRQAVTAITFWETK